MAVQVSVRIRNLDDEDLASFRTWLERTYPGDWREQPDPEAERSLGAAEILQGVLDNLAQGVGTGLVTVTADMLRKQIVEKFKQYKENYPADEQPEIDVEAEDAGPGSPETRGKQRKDPGDAPGRPDAAEK